MHWGRNELQSHLWPPIPGPSVPVFDYLQAKFGPRHWKENDLEFLGGRGVLEVLGKDVLGRGLVGAQDVPREGLEMH